MPVQLKSLIAKLNSTVRQTLESAAGLCFSRTHYEIELEHYLIKLVDEPDTDFDLISRHFGVDRPRFVRDLNRGLDKLKSGNARTPAFSHSLLKLFSDAWIVASINHDETQIRTGHTVLALLSGQFEQFLEPQGFGSELKRVDPAQLSANYLKIVRTSSESSRETDTPRLSAGSMRSTRFFISYRRGDSGPSAGRLYDHLVEAFGRDRVFFDVSSIEPGELYTVVLADVILQCDAVVAVIGTRWNRAIAGQSGRRQLDKEDDWVRFELAMAIEKGKRIIPCLVDGAKPPRFEQLPPALRDVTRRQAFEISQNQFERDMESLVDLLKKVKPAVAQAPGPT